MITEQPPSGESLAASTSSGLSAHFRGKKRNRTRGLAVFLAALCAYALVIGFLVLGITTVIGKLVDPTFLRVALQGVAAGLLIVGGGLACLPVFSLLNRLRPESH